MAVRQLDLRDLPTAAAVVDELAEELGGIDVLVNCAGTGSAQHVIWDELIPPSAVLPTVHDYWNRGADLRFYTMPLPEHLVNSVAGWPPAVAWTSAILRGLPPGPRFKADFQIPG